jgi:hypothetical protein
LIVLLVLTPHTQPAEICSAGAGLIIPYYPQKRLMKQYSFRDYQQAVLFSGGDYNVCMDSTDKQAGARLVTRRGLQKQAYSV